MFRVAQISDTHLGAAKPFFAPNFECSLAAVAARPADLIVHSGDITLDGAEDDADLAAARRRHDAVGIPVLAIPGNHDIGDNPDAPVPPHHPPQPIDDARRQRYLRHFGPDRWRHDIPGWRLIGINSQLLGSDLAAAAEQEAFTADAVASSGDRRIVLFTHKPLCDRHLNETGTGGRFITPIPRRRLLDAFAGSRPALIASGHVHQYRAATIGDTQHVWAPSTGFILPDELQPCYGAKDVGYVEHRLYADGRHESEFMRPSAAQRLVITDFPQAYGAFWERPATA